MKWLYRVSYRRRGDYGSHIYHQTVLAASADEARRLVAELDPGYIGTVRSPRRRAEAVEAAT